jgi:hypothetical protein
VATRFELLYALCAVGSLWKRGYGAVGKNAGNALSRPEKMQGKCQDRVQVFDRPFKTLLLSQVFEGSFSR